MSLPENSCLIMAELIREGDQVRHHAARFDFVVEEVDTDTIGNVRLRANDGTLTISYHPQEMLYITRGTRPLSNS